MLHIIKKKEKTQKEVIRTLVWGQLDVFEEGGELPVGKGLGKLWI